MSSDLEVIANNTATAAPIYVASSSVILDDIDSEIVNFRLKGDVLLQGDFNARTGSMPQFAVHDDDNQLL